jgi:hypothetical protein
MYLPLVCRLTWDFAFLGRRNGSLSAEEDFEGSPVSCFVLLDSRLKTPFRRLDGEAGGAGAGKGTSAALFSPLSLFRSADKSGCFSWTGETTA